MKIHVKKTARKELMRLPDDILIKTFTAVLELGKNPYPRGFDKVEGQEGKLRVWIDRNYRILYEVNSKIDRLDIVGILKKDEKTYK